MRRALIALLAGAVLLAPVRSALAAGEEIEGRGFRARAPLGFRLTDSNDENRKSGRTFAKTLASGGELVLVLTSHESPNENLARTEMALGRMVDLIPAPKPLVSPAQTDGAEDAFEVLTQNEQQTIRSLSARQDTVVVTMTLTAPAGADEDADEAWVLAKGSLRLVHPGAGIGTLVVYLLGALVLLAVLVTLVKQRKKQVAPRRYAPATEQTPPVRALPRDPFAPDPIASAQHDPSAPEAASAEAHEAQPFVDVLADPFAAPSAEPAAAVPGVPTPSSPPGGGFSRAEDGLPIFTPAQKAAGISLDKPRRRPDPIRPAPLPVKSPGPAPLNRPPSPRPPIPVVKPRTGA